MKNNPTDDSILKEYEKADAAGKQILERLYGESAFKQNNYKNLKTIEDCCKQNNYNPNDIKVTVPDQLKEFDDSIQSYVECLIAAKAIRHGDKIDYENSKQLKYYPYFIYKPGVGFSFNDSYSGYSDTDVGSRLSFLEKEQSDYFGIQFIKSHNKRLL